MKPSSLPCQGALVTVYDDFFFRFKIICRLHMEHENRVCIESAYENKACIESAYV